MTATGASHEQTCRYCGLPLAGAPALAAGAAGTPLFCCLGCRLAFAMTAEGGDEGHTRWTLTRLGLAVFFTMNVMMFTMVLWTRDVYGAARDTEAAARILDDVLRYLCLVLSAPVLLLLGLPMLEEAFEQLRRRRITADLLIVAGAVASFGYSAVSVFRGGGHVYFEVGCVVLAAVTLGRWLEALGRNRVTRCLQALSRLLPDRVRRVVAGTLQEVPISALEAGDVLQILPGERIPVDGEIVHGAAQFDEQTVTGESAPRSKTVGDPVWSGALSLDGTVLLRATRPASDSTLQRLANAVREAAETRGRVQRLADRISAWFFPFVVVAAAATAAAHWTARGPEQALLAALAVVLIACPCALGIATPMALWAAFGRASQAQVLIRDADVLVNLGRVRTICFDKTGTLTTGQPRVAEVLLDETTGEPEFWAKALAAASASQHALATAVQRHTGPLARWEAPATVTTLPGRGIAATLLPATGDAAPTVVFLGSLELMAQSGCALGDGLRPRLASARQRGLPLVAVGWDGHVRGIFIIDEQVRSKAAEVSASLQRGGIRVVMLTGDREARARQLAASMNLEVRSGLLPEDKQRAIRELQATAGPVAMIGDGLNDAPSLAQADIGIALGCGVDVSREAAAVCLLSDDLARIPWCIALARRTTRTVQQNLFWAFSYNLGGMALAAANLLHPAVAAAAMAVSSLIVVSNSLRLAQFDDPLWPAPDTMPSPRTRDEHDTRGPGSSAGRVQPSPLLQGSAT